MMKGKLAIVTGATSGIGKEIAAQLASQGAEVLIACRDVHKGQRTVEEIAKRTGNDRLSVMEVDTASRQSIRDFAQKLKASHTHLDVLVNNAGVNVRRRQTSVDGIELTFATNVLGYFLVTRELLDVLEASAPARIVNVASTFAGNLDLEDLQFERRPYDPIKAYQQSKACNRLFTWALARRLTGTGVTANAMAPGLVFTGLYRNTPVALRALLRVIAAFRGRSIPQGADTAVWLASSPDGASATGRFYELRQERACEFRDEATEERLWTACEKMADRS
jgi:NAD(P)-dependent dehydrogenase (short-subunit alcohol dehydrogenase family)